MANMHLREGSIASGVFSKWNQTIASLPKQPTVDSSTQGNRALCIPSLGDAETDPRHQYTQGPLLFNMEH